MYHLRDWHFVVGERQILELIRHSRCQECEAQVVPESIVEGEKITAGVKYNFTCTVSLANQIITAYIRLVFNGHKQTTSFCT